MKRILLRITQFRGVIIMNMLSERFGNCLSSISSAVRATTVEREHSTLGTAASHVNHVKQHHPNYRSLGGAVRLSSLVSFKKIKCNLLLDATLVETCPHKW